MSYFAAGELVNFLEKARAITPSPLADTLFPKTRLYDGYADAICRHNANSADTRFTFDLAMLDKDGGDNGDLDTWSGGAPTAWTVVVSGGGSVEQSSPGRGGAGSEAKIIRNNGAAKIVKTYKVRSGQRWNYSIWMKKLNNGSMVAYLYNPVTKKYWTGSVWDSVSLTFAQETVSETYVEKTGSFTVEDLRTCGDSGVTYLELSLHDGAGVAPTDAGFVDDVFLNPTWNSIIVAGHNLETGMAPKLRSSTDNFGAVDTQEAALTVRQPSFYAYLSTPSTRRWARLATTGTQSSIAGAPYYGEIAITYLETGAYPDWGFDLKYYPDSIVTTTPGGKVIASRTTQQRRRALRITSGLRSDAAFREVRDELHGRCHGSVFPLIFVPVQAEDVVFHGRLNDSWEAKRLFLAAWEEDMVIADNPFPRVT